MASAASFPHSMRADFMTSDPRRVLAPNMSCRIGCAAVTAAWFARTVSAQLRRLRLLAVISLRCETGFSEPDQPMSTDGLIDFVLVAEPFPLDCLFLFRIFVVAVHLLERSKSAFHRNWPMQTFTPLPFAIPWVYSAANPFGARGQQQACALIFLRSFLCVCLYCIRNKRFFRTTHNRFQRSTSMFSLIHHHTSKSMSIISIRILSLCQTLARTHVHTQTRTRHTHTHTNITHHQRAAAAVEEIRESNKHTHTAKRKPSTVCDASEPRSGRCVFHPIGGKQRTIAYGSLRELARRARPLVRFYVCTICVAAAVAAAADAATTFHSTPASHGLVSILCLCIVRVCVCSWGP